MKKNLLNKLWLRVGMIVAIMTTALSGTAWATEVTFDFSNANGVHSAQEKTNTWSTNYCTIVQAKGSSTATDPSGSYLSSPRWYKGNTVIFTPAPNITITKIVINCSSTNYNGQTISASSGSVSVSGDNSTWTGSITTSSSLNLTMGKQCRPSSVVITYTSSSSEVATTTTIDNSGITNTDVYAGTIAGSLSATVTANGSAVSGATITWSGNNNSVATIDASTGVVTLVAAGTVTFTANYAGVSGEYESSSDTYKMTVTNSAPDYAVLPFSWAGGVRSNFEALNGCSTHGAGDYPNQDTYQIKLDDSGDYILIKTDSRPGVVTFGVKMVGGNVASTIKVQQSADGDNFTDVQGLTISGAQNDVLTLSTTTEFAETSRYVRLYFTKGSNVGVGPISIAAYAPIVLSDYTLTIDNPANVTITATYGEEVLTNGDNAEVTQGTEVSLVVTPATGYVFESLTIEGEEEGQTVTPTEENGVYTFSMPAYDVTVSATVTEYVPPVEGTYVLATSITPGKIYVIANADGTKVMGKTQNNNNRAAVDASLEGTTLTAADACEFTVGSSDSYYTFFDPEYNEGEGGYLYAAGNTSGANYLRTQTINNANGEWAITFDEETNVATVIAQGSNNRNMMQYNNTNDLFSCYQTPTQTAIKLYEKVEAPTSQTVTVKSVGYATFVAEADLEIPANVEVYAVTVNEAATSAHLEAITGGIPANVAVLVKASEDTYEFPYATEAVAALTIDNDLKAATVAFKPSAANTIYCLAKKGDPAKVGFYPVATTVTIPAGKAYLEVTSGETPVKGFYGFEEDDPTGISNLNANFNANEGAIYNLSGQMVNGKLPKGIYIVNGKKILK